MMLWRVERLSISSRNVLGKEYPVIERNLDDYKRNIDTLTC